MGREVWIQVKTDENAELAWRVKALEFDLEALAQRVRVMHTLVEEMRATVASLTDDRSP
jgi:cell division protein FtsB